MKPRYFSLRFTFLVLSCFCSFSLSSQIWLNEEWVHTSGLPDTIDYSTGKVDGSGNVYVTTNTISATEKANILTTKYNSSGVVQWEVEKDNTDENDYGTAIEIDGSGNVYVGAATWVDGTNKYDYMVIKYNSSGSQQWVATYNGPGNFYDIPSDIYIDGGGNVYVTGMSYGSGTMSDYCTIKYNSSGTAQWTSRYNYSSNSDVAAIIKSGPSSTVIVVGASESTLGNWDFAAVKYNQSTGAQVATNRNSASGNGFDQVYGAYVDASGNIYITGRAAVVDEGFNMRTIKLEDDLDLAWARNFDLDGLDDESHGVIVDQDGNVYITGWVTNEDNTRSFITVKYNSSGTAQWYRKEDAPNENRDSYGLKISSLSDDNIVVAGNIDNGNSLDYLTIIYNSDGDRLWMEQYDSPDKADDKVNFVKADVDDVYYVGGKSYGISTSTNRLIKYSSADYIVPPDDDLEHPLQLTFFENKGQLINTDDEVEEDVKFYSFRHSPSLFFADDKLSYVWARIDTTDDEDTVQRVDMTFVGSNGSAEIHRAVSQGGEYLNYYLGHCPDGIVGVRNSDRLIVSGLYDDVDLEYYSDINGLKYYFIIKPGYSEQSDPIILNYEGADDVNILGGGESEIVTSIGTITQKIADAYQIDETGDLSALGWDAEYVDVDDNQIGFDLGIYDDGLPLIIEVSFEGVTGAEDCDNDIVNTIWSSMYGGDRNELMTDVKADRYGNVFICGNTNSHIFPAELLIEDDLSGDTDDFIQKFNSDSSPDWGLYVGGTLSENNAGLGLQSVPSLAINSKNEVYLCGATISGDFPFPDVPYEPTEFSYNDDAITFGYSDAYICRFSNDGTTYIWGTYFGLDQSDIIFGAAVDDNDNIYVVGKGGATTEFFPFYDPDGGSDFYQTGLGPFVAVFNDFAEQLWCTALTGTLNDQAIDVAVSGGGMIYIVGTAVSGSSIPITVGAEQDSYGGGLQDGFVAVFNSDFSEEMITYLGGAGNEYLRAVALDNSSNTIVAGWQTPQDAATGFPTVNTFGGATDAYQSTFQGGVADGILAYYNFAGGSPLKLATYIGGPGWDYIYDVAADSRIFAFGYNALGDFPLEEMEGFYYDDEEETYNITVFALEGSERLLSTYYGGNQTVSNKGIAIDMSDTKIYLTGNGGFGNSDECFEPLNDIGGWFRDQPYSYGFSNDEGFVSILGIDGPTSTEELVTNSSTIIIWPNPTDGILNISSSIKITDIEVFNVNGSKVFKSSDLNGMQPQINVEPLPAGIYILKLFSIDSGEFQSLKFEVQ